MRQRHTARVQRPHCQTPEATRPDSHTSPFMPASSAMPGPRVSGPMVMDMVVAKCCVEGSTGTTPGEVSVDQPLGPAVLWLRLRLCRLTWGNSRGSCC